MFLPRYSDDLDIRSLKCPSFDFSCPLFFSRPEILDFAGAFLAVFDVPPLSALAFVCSAFVDFLESCSSLPLALPVSATSYKLLAYVSTL